jgi:hypothetical protein
MVERKGRLFRFGDYPDQKFSLTRAEWEAANAGVTEVPVGFDPIGRRHYVGKDNAFDGLLGSASNIVASDEDITADFHLDPLLHAAVEREGLKMSAVFSRQSKVLKQIDFVDAPVISDAALFADDPDEVAIFSDFPALPPESEAREDADEDEQVEASDVAQQLHEVIAHGFPSLCDPEHMTKHAAFCAADKKPSHLIALHDLCIHYGARCSGMADAHFAEEEYPVAENAEVESPQIDTAEFADLKETVKALKAENERLAKIAARDKAARIETESAAFAKDHADKIPPPAQPFFIGLYRSLAEADDEATVGFAFGKDGAESFKGSRLDLLKRAVGSLKPHAIAGAKTLDKDVPAPAKTPEGVVVFSNDDREPVDPKKPTPAGAKPDKDRLAHLAQLLN